MKKDKEWFINELLGHEIGDYGNYYNSGYEDGLAYALQLGRQLDEPEKVVIPQFVADAFESAKGDSWFASQLISAMYESSDEVGYWLEVPSNEKLLLRAWLDGYEVEKEKLYYTVDEKGQTLLFKSQDRGILRSNGADLEKVLSVYEHRHPNMYQLTEKEIKDYDERYWMFKKEVTQ